MASAHRTQQTLGVDRKLNIYVSGTTPGDTIAKYDSDGHFLSDFGHRGPKIPAKDVKQNNQQTDIFPPGIGAFDCQKLMREVKAFQSKAHEGWDGGPLEILVYGSVPSSKLRDGDATVSPSMSYNFHYNGIYGNVLDNVVLAAFRSAYSPTPHIRAACRKTPPASHAPHSPRR